jgi:hypothetical protein
MPILTNDFVAPFDPTGYPSITGAQLLQLVSGLAPFTGVGLVISTNDIAGVAQVPPANTTVKWQNYMWLRVSATYVTAYIWNPNGASDPTYSNWVTIASAAIGPGTIQGYQIATNTIPSTAIISIGSTQITGSVVPAWLAQLNLAQTAYATNGLMNSNSFVFGDLAGAGSTVAMPVIAPLAVTQGKIALQAVAGNPVAGTGQIKDNSITTLQLLSNANTPSTPLLIAAVDPAVNITLPTKSVIGVPGVASLTQNIAAGDVLGVAYNKTGYTPINRAILNLPDPASDSSQNLYIPRVNGTTYNLVPFTGRLTQRTFQQDNTTTYSDTTHIAVTGVPTFAAGTLWGVAGNVGGSIISIIPSSASSKIRISVLAYIGCNTSGVSYISLALFSDTTGAKFTGFSGGTNSILATCTGGGSIGGTLQLQLQAEIVSGQTTEIDFCIRFGADASTTYLNKTYNGAATLFGGNLYSWISVEEYI